jgi:hypothetical protein
MVTKTCKKFHPLSSPLTKHDVHEVAEVLLIRGRVERDRHRAGPRRAGHCLLIRLPLLPCGGNRKELSENMRSSTSLLAFIRIRHLMRLPLLPFSKPRSIASCLSCCATRQPRPFTAVLSGTLFFGSSAWLPILSECPCCCLAPQNGLS